MRTTKYTITSKRIIALALALVLITTMFVGCNSTNKDEPPTTTTEVQTSIEIVNEIVTDDKGEAVTDDNGETLTTEVTKIVKVESQSDKDNEPSSKKSDTTTSTTKSSTTTTTNQTEPTTKKNISTGNSNKTTTTTKPVVTTCNHNWKLISYTNGCYVYNCTKCDDYKSEEREMNPNDFMGNKSEYLELLGYINEARRKAGLNELIYIDEFQQGANTRAIELTEKFSHTRPNGTDGNTAYKYSSLYRNIYGTCGENIVSGADTAKSAFNSWMNSSGHKKAILDELAIGFVASRCGNYWVMQTFYDYAPYK